LDPETPIGVVRGTQEMHYALTANVLSAGEPSSWSKQVLHRMNLTERFAADPTAALNTVHKSLAHQLSEDRLQEPAFRIGRAFLSSCRERRDREKAFCCRSLNLRLDRA
jgi:hypothetical protein